jgi:hypothetical protein
MKLILGLLVLALGGVLGTQWADWPPQAPGPDAGATAEQGQVPDPTPADPLALLQPLDDKEDYAVVTERPLFMPDRRPPEDQPEEALPEPMSDQSLDQVDLNAVLITPSESIAWVMDAASREVRRVRQGDEVSGWEIRDILSDRVVLERQGETNTLVLRDYARMAPPPPRPQPAARTPPRVPAATQRPSADNRNLRARPNGERPRPPKE